MLRFIRRFRKAEDGAVTVDWVVLTAAMTVFGVGVATIISNAATDPADSIGAQLTTIANN